MKRKPVRLKAWRQSPLKICIFASDFLCAMSAYACSALRSHHDAVAARLAVITSHQYSKVYVFQVDAIPEY